MYAHQDTQSQLAPTIGPVSTNNPGLHDSQKCIPAIVPKPIRRMDNFLEEIQDQFERKMRVDSLLLISRKLQAEFKVGLQSSRKCMLPSYNYTLPTGEEQGTYLALEVGGSSLRVSLMELSGHQSMLVRRIEHSRIDKNVRNLEGLAFFDWIAARIREMVVKETEIHERMLGNRPLKMGIAWSFPIEQTSIRSGRVLEMGKGFRCSEGILGQDLDQIITLACQRAKLNVSLEAIVNDSSAALLSRAYFDPATRLAFILGTGMNAAIHLPISSLGRSKFGLRPFLWNTDNTHVLVNTELGMFGKSLFPVTRWDQTLNANHLLPDYQPFEYLVTGGYLSEIVRLILVEATQTTNLFGGRLPLSLWCPYSLNTHTIAIIHADTSPMLSKSCALIQQHHPSESPLTASDLEFIRQVIIIVSNRSSSYFTAGIHALWSLLNLTEGIDPATNNGDNISIACDGSVINKYPGFMAKCQGILNRMTEKQGYGSARVVLEKAGESASQGAAIAAAMAARTV